MEGALRILNWNIGGAKYLESRSGSEGEPGTREHYRRELNASLMELTDSKHGKHPHIVALQEVVEFEGPDGKGRCGLLDPIPGYAYCFTPLIDTERHSHQGKWLGTRIKGGWHCANPEANANCVGIDGRQPCGGKGENCKKVYFAQGNAILIRNDLPRYPVWELPELTNVRKRYAEGRARIREKADNWATPPQLDGGSFVEVVPIECGLYFGDRNTEPRAALVAHVVLHDRADESGLDMPLDVFIVNVHLTTLMKEREGVPGIDEMAAKTRMRQLDIVLNDIVSRYNLWRSSYYKIRGEDKTDADLRSEASHNRHNPVWIITGDLNCTPESLEYQTLVRRGFVDMIKLGPDTHQRLMHQPTKSRGVGQDATITLDYVFAGPRFEAIAPNPDISRSSVIDYIKVSDHKPLLAEIPIDVRAVVTSSK